MKRTIKTVSTDTRVKHGNVYWRTVKTVITDTRVKHGNLYW